VSLRIKITYIHCTHLGSSSISLLAVSRAIPGWCWSGNQHFTLAWRIASIQQTRGCVRGCEREPTVPDSPSTPFNSYHYHYRCHPNHTTHSTPAIDIFTPPIQLAVMWCGQCSLFFSISLLRLFYKAWKYTFLFTPGLVYINAKYFVI
jgi:hypothetical protein